MGRFSSVVTKLNCFHRQRNPEKHVPIPQDDYDVFRARGQEILRSMLIQSEQQGQCVNWAAAIGKATESSADDDMVRHERINRLKDLKRSLERRRRFDSAGSFSINMLTYKAVDAIRPSQPVSPGKASNFDDRSRSSASTKSNATTNVIDEDTEY
jgi:hypothetical protein